VKALKILSIQTNWLLCRGFARLLGDEFDVIIIECESADLHQLIFEISQLKPDVILSSDSSLYFIKTLLEPIQEVFPSMYVIVVAENSNWLTIYSNKIIKFVHILDLKELIAANWQGPALNYQFAAKKDGDVQNKCFSSPS
jgi:hypothetical protein